jgi:hypothetical protein
MCFLPVGSHCDERAVLPVTVVKEQDAPRCCTRPPGPDPSGVVHQLTAERVHVPELFKGTVAEASVWRPVQFQDRQWPGPHRNPPTRANNVG